MALIDDVHLPSGAAPRAILRSLDELAHVLDGAVRRPVDLNHRGIDFAGDNAGYCRLAGSGGPSQEVHVIVTRLRQVSAQLGNALAVSDNLVKRAWAMSGD